MQTTSWVSRLVATSLGLVAVGAGPPAHSVDRAIEQEQITILYDAFGKASAMPKDWGFAALIEYGEVAFEILRRSFGDRYVYAGLGTTMKLAGAPVAAMKGQTAQTLDEADLQTYRALRLGSHDDEPVVLARRRE